MNLNNQKIIKFRKEGFSIREICKELRLSYGTVQRTCSNIKMSKKGLKYYSKLNGLTRNISFKDELNETKVRIISNLLFDGAVYNNHYHYSIMYVNSSKELISQFIKGMKKVYSVKPSVFEDNNRYQRVKYLSKRIYIDLLKYLKTFSTSNEKCEISSIIISNKSFKQIVLQALWENEGAITKRGDLIVNLKSENVIKQLSKMHSEFGFKHTVRIKKEVGDYGVSYIIFIIKSKENYKRFIDLKLFSKSIVTRGKNKGKKKIDILKDYFNNKYK